MFILGGEDFDQRVMEYFIKLYKKKKGKDIRGNNRAIQKLRREVEKAKRALSSQHQARIEIESFFDGDDFSETLTRAKFEELNMVRFSDYCWVLKQFYHQLHSCFVWMECTIHFVFLFTVYNFFELHIIFTVLIKDLLANFVSVL